MQVSGSIFYAVNQQCILIYSGDVIPGREKPSFIITLPAHTSVSENTAPPQTR